MVAQCAGCDSYEPWAAILIGAMAGPVFIGIHDLMLKLRLDDPLDAVAVHGGGGTLGNMSSNIETMDKSSKTFISRTFTVTVLSPRRWYLLGWKHRSSMEATWYPNCRLPCHCCLVFCLEFAYLWWYEVHQTSKDRPRNRVQRQRSNQTW